MQYALQKLWDVAVEQEATQLTVAMYADLSNANGGQSSLWSLLNQKITLFYDCLDTPQQNLVQWLFLKLVQLGEGIDDTRKTVLEAELLQRHPQQAAQIKVLLAHKALFWGTMRYQNNIIEIASFVTLNTMFFKYLGDKYMNNIKQTIMFDQQELQELLDKAEEQIIEQSKRIDFYITEYSIELLAQKMRNGDFEVPEYQREFVWEKERKSRFLESLLMGLPIPFLFFWESPSTGKLEIVDGSQRLRTIQEFIHEDFQLTDLSELSLLSGLRFKDLAESRQRKIKNRSIRGIILNEHTDEHSRFELFDRINTGSKIAEPVEVRRGALGGCFLNLVKRLAESKLFINLAPVPKQKRKQREHEELVTRFFAYSDGLEGYKDRVSEFLYNYTKKMNKILKEQSNLESEYEKRFMNVMKFVEKNFPNGFRKTVSARTTPRSRFEAIALGSYKALLEKKEIENATIDMNWLNAKEFSEITGADGANAKNRLERRINYVRDKLISNSEP